MSSANAPSATERVAALLDAVRVEEDEYYLHPDGYLHGPQGLMKKASKGLREFVELRSTETAEKYFRFMRGYLAFRMEGETGLPAIVEESFDDAQERQAAYYRSHGWKLDTPRPFDGAVETHPDNPGYEKFRRLAIHKLYDIMYAAKVRPDNPTYTTGWREADLQTRTSAAHLTSDNEHAARHAGRKFLPPPVASSTSIPVEPEECAAQLAEDLDLAEAPSDVIDLDDIMEMNGCRPFSVLTATLFGWAQAGLEDEVLARNKWRGEKLDITLVLPQTALENLRRRLAVQPSPLDDRRTLLQEVELAADRVESGRDEGDAEAFLRSLPLLVRENTSEARTYDSARYHYTKGRRLRLDGAEAARDAGAEVTGPNPATRFTDGRRQPVMSDHRRCSITRDVRELFESTRNESEREAGLERIAGVHGQSSDQSKRYADAAYREEDRRRSRADLARKKQRLDEIRSRSPVPLRPEGPGTDGARRQAEFLARRPD